MGKNYTALGLMSGTSLDGVDVSVIESDGNKEFTPILDRYFEYDKELIKKILDMRDKISNPDGLKRYFGEIKDLEREITLFHGKAVNETLEDGIGTIDIIRDEKRAISTTDFTDKIINKYRSIVEN